MTFLRKVDACPLGSWRWQKKSDCFATATDWLEDPAWWGEATPGNRCEQTVRRTIHAMISSFGLSCERRRQRPRPIECILLFAVGSSKSMSRAWESASRDDIHPNQIKARSIFKSRLEKWTAISSYKLNLLSLNVLVRSPSQIVFCPPQALCAARVSVQSRSIGARVKRRHERSQ